MKRTPLRHRRPESVPTIERAAVYVRDRVCFLYRLNPEHVCRDQWGNPHAPDDLGRMTVDHVSEFAGGMKGKRSVSDRGHMVQLCWAGNVAVPSKVVRQAQRAYLAEVA